MSERMGPPSSGFSSGSGYTSGAGGTFPTSGSFGSGAISPAKPKYMYNHNLHGKSTLNYNLSLNDIEDFANSINTLRLILNGISISSFKVSKGESIETANAKLAEILKGKKKIEEDLQNAVDVLKKFKQNVSKKLTRINPNKLVVKKEVTDHLKRIRTVNVDGYYKQIAYNTKDYFPRSTIGINEYYYDEETLPYAQRDVEKALAYYDENIVKLEDADKQSRELIRSIQQSLDRIEGHARKIDNLFSMTHSKIINEELGNFFQRNSSEIHIALEAIGWIAFGVTVIATGGGTAAIAAGWTAFIAGIGNAALYTSEGDYISAGLSGVSGIIPFGIAAKTSFGALKGITAAKSAREVAQIVIGASKSGTKALGSFLAGTDDFVRIMNGWDELTISPNALLDVTVDADTYRIIDNILNTAGAATQTITDIVSKEYAKAMVDGTITSTELYRLVIAVFEALAKSVGKGALHG
ncbi:MAG: hypothetical protein ACRCUP_00160 [Mycoplasmatales bacterium]